MFSLRKVLGAAVVAAFAFSVSVEAFAQGAVQQVGPVTAGDAPAWVQGGYLGDSGSAAGGPTGVGLGQLLIQSRAWGVAPSSANGFGAGPFQNTGLGQYGSHHCEYAGSPSSSSGDYFLCFDPYTAVGSFSGGLISYGAIGSAAPLPLGVDINGVLYQFPFALSGVVCPGTTVIGDIMTFGNTSGTLCADSGVQVTGLLHAANNLSDVANAATSLANLGGLSSATAASTYLTQTNAASTYLTQTSAASTYLTQANAAAAYLPHVASIAALELLNPATITAPVIWLEGCVTNGDGCEGQFYTAPSSTATADAAVIVQATGVTTGRWIRVVPSNYYSVKWYGATGNGTTDDTAAVEAWLASCAAGTGLTSGVAPVCWLDPGTYKLTSGFIISVAATHIECPSPQSSVFYYANTSTYMASTAAYVTIDNCGFTGPGSGGTGSVSPVISEADHFTFTNNFVNQFGSTSSNGILQAIKGSFGLIQHNTFSANGDFSSIFINNVQGANSMYDWRVFDNNTDTGINIYTSYVGSSLSNIIVSRNIITDATANTFCLTVQQAQAGYGSTVVNVTADHNQCTLYANGTYGGYSFGGVQEFTIDHNTFNSLGFTYGIKALEITSTLTQHAIVADGTVVGNELALNGSGDGMDCNACNNVSITGNVITALAANSPVWFGIDLSTQVGTYTGLSTITVTGNTIALAPSSNASAIIIECNDSTSGVNCENFNVTGNTITSDGTTNSFGINVIDAHGTMSYFNIGSNVIQSPYVGIFIGTGVTHVCLLTGLNTATTPVTNNGASSVCA